MQEGENITLLLGWLVVKGNNLKINPPNFTLSTSPQIAFLVWLICHALFLSRGKKEGKKIHSAKSKSALISVQIKR